jgi:hypothetical protein
MFHFLLDLPKLELRQRNRTLSKWLNGYREDSADSLDKTVHDTTSSVGRSQQNRKFAEWTLGWLFVRRDR